ncbi:MAG: acyl carrier protein [Pseudobutyrivibrio sp.]|nr:acyl carrier protein [Pseudobutyrivibrio sp.]
MREKIIEILSEIVADFDPAQTGLIDNGVLSSLDLLQFISEVDDELDIAIPPTKIKPANFNSVDEIVKLLESLD